jgi:glycosyltransferase involved in cell wall biosynthesis
MTRRLRHVAVVVPAADEADSLAGCLAAIERARRQLADARPTITTDLVVVLDACRDRTAEVIATAAPAAHTVTIAARCVGVARDVGTRAAIDRSIHRAPEVWTAHTDADSVVPDHWLTEQVRLADLGADLVLGTVVPDLDEPLLSHWRIRHRDHDGHPHVHGANLGIRADTSAAVGGWPPLRSGEDAALALRVAAAGHPIARPGGLPVLTSARRQGRAPKGFSSYLRDLERSTTD